MSANTLTRVQTGDDATNRSFEQVRQAVNPALKNLQSKVPVTGSKGGNAALASLITALAQAGIIEDQTT